MRNAVDLRRDDSLREAVATIAIIGKSTLPIYSHEEESVMQAIFWNREDVAHRANELYGRGIRTIVETDENIGKMILIDVESGDYAIGENDLDAVDILRQKNPNARLFGIRIGYDVAVALGGAVMERITK